MTFVHKETGELHPNSAELLEKSRNASKKRHRGLVLLDKSELLSAEDCEHYDKLPDTMDVWFDSGSTHYSVVKQREEWNGKLTCTSKAATNTRLVTSSMLTGCASSMDAHRINSC